MTTVASLPFTFEDAEVPAETRGGRKADPNPYTDVVSALHASLVESGNVTAKAFHIPAAGRSEKDVQADVGKAVRQLRAVGASAETPYTARTKSEPSSAKVGKETVPTVKVSFWLHTTEKDGKNVPALIEKRRGSTSETASE